MIKHKHTADTRRVDQEETADDPARIVETCQCGAWREVFRDNGTFIVLTWYQSGDGSFN